MTGACGRRTKGKSSGISTVKIRMLDEPRARICELLVLVISLSSVDAGNGCVVRLPTAAHEVSVWPTLFSRWRSVADTIRFIGSRTRTPIRAITVPSRSELPPSPTTLSWTLGHRELHCALSAGKPEITPSSDLWIADSTCTDNCDGINTFNPSQSSSFTNSSTPFAIKYGSGNAEGFLGKDVVQVAGFSVPNQVFGKPPSSCTPRSGSETELPQLCVIPSLLVSSRLQSPA